MQAAFSCYYTVVSLLLKAAIDGEFLFSSDNPFQIRVTEGRNVLQYCCDFAGAV